jgi:hypothetical protein
LLREVMFGQKMVGQPECGAIHQHHLARLRRSQRCPEVKRCLDRDPALPPVRAMPRDAVAHLVIPCLGGGDIAAGQAAAGDKSLGQPGFAGPRAPDHEAERGEQENFVRH